jgi:hypothetical protein
MEYVFSEWNHGSSFDNEVDKVEEDDELIIGTFLLKEGDEEICGVGKQLFIFKTAQII